MEMLTKPNSAQHEAEEAWSRDPERILHTLEQVLASPPFRNTQQCQTLLRYIVKHTLAGEDHLLRERVIGSEVFGRRPDYETGEDPVENRNASGCFRVQACVRGSSGGIRTAPPVAGAGSPPGNRFPCRGESTT